MKFKIELCGSRFPRLAVVCPDCGLEMNQIDGQANFYTHPKTEGTGFLYLKQVPIKCPNVGQKYHIPPLTVEGAWWP